MLAQSCNQDTILDENSELCWNARNRAGIWLSNRPTRIHRLEESIPGLHKSLKIPSLDLGDKSRRTKIRLFSMGATGVSDPDPH
jgi:hypothetical protein